MWRRIILIFIGLVFACSSVQSQCTHYVILLWGDTIGNMDVCETRKGAELRREISNEVSFSFFGTHTLTYGFINHLKNGKLFKASSESKRNNDLKSYSKIWWEKDRYQIVVDDERSTYHSPLDDNTVTGLYFREPFDRTKTFSERFGTMCKVKRAGEHQYELHLPNGKKNVYSYVDGVCTEVIVNHPLATFYFVQVK